MFEPSQPLVVVQCTEATPTTETNPQSCPARSTQQERRSCFPLEPFSLLKELLPTCYYSYLGLSWSGLIVDFVSRSQRWFGVMMMHFWIFFVRCMDRIGRVWCRHVNALWLFDQGICQVMFDKFTVSRIWSYWPEWLPIVRCSSNSCWRGNTGKKKNTPLGTTL